MIAHRIKYTLLLLTCSMLFSIGNAQDVFNKVYNYQNDYYDA